MISENLNFMFSVSVILSVSGKAGNYKNYVLGSGKISDSMLKYDKLLNMGSNVNVTGDTYNSCRQNTPDGVINARP